MACDSGPQESPPPWHTAAAGAPKKLLPDRERRRRRALQADEEEEEQADAFHHAGHARARTSEVVGSFSMDDLGRLCKGSDAPTTLLLPQERARVLAIPSMDNSTVDLLSYLQDPKAVRLLAEETREICEVPCEDNVEECVTPLAVLLLLVEEKISAPVSVVVEGISTKRSCYNVTIMLQLSVSSRNGSLLLKNMGTIFVGCLPFSLNSGGASKTANYSSKFGLVEKSALTGLKRGRQFQIRNIVFVEFEGEEGVRDARYQMLGKRMDVKGAFAGPYLPAELQGNTCWRQFIHQWTKANHNMLDGELCEKHNNQEWCPLPVQCLPSWFLISGNWLPGFLVGETEKLKERYTLNDLESDSGTTNVLELGHGVHSYDKPRHPVHFLPGVLNVPENALKGTHSADTRFRYLHGLSLAILTAPMSKRVEVISSLDKSTGDLLSYLPDLQADAEEGCVTALAMLVVVEEDISSQASEVAEDMSMKRSICNSIADAALSTRDALSRDGRGNPLLCKVQILSQLRVVSWRDHNIKRIRLSPLLRDAKNCVAVQDDSMSCAKLLLCFETDMKVQDLRKHGPTHMAAFPDMCFNLNSASMVPWDISSLQENQVMSNESGAWLLNDEFDYFNKSYTGVKASACHWHFVSRKCSLEMAKSHCALKQDSKFMPRKHYYYKSNILVGCIARTVDSVLAEYLTACFNAELVYVEKPLVNELNIGNEMKPQDFGFLEFKIEKGVLDAIARASLLSPPKWIPLAKSFSCDIIELPESATDHQYPIDPPTASITEGSSHHIESQQVDACSKSNVQNQQGNNCSRNEKIPIFVRQISGKVVVLTVNLDDPSKHMMCLYEEKTKMKLSYQYLRYERKTIDPEHTLLFYGVGRNSTVHSCGRLLGGMPTTLASYVHDNGEKFLKEVTLPNGKISLKITKKGCRFLSTWLKCFTTAFAMGKSWSGEFTLNDFKHVDGHIQIIKKPKIYPSGSMEKDLSELVIHVEEILHSDKEYLISKYPPYLKNLTRFLSHMTINGVLSAQDKLLVETHVCCTTSSDRETLVISLYRRYEGLNEDEMTDWDDAIEKASFPFSWSSTLSQLEAFGDGRGYPKSRLGAFRLIKDVAVHATDNCNVVSCQD